MKAGKIESIFAGVVLLVVIGLLTRYHNYYDEPIKINGISQITSSK